MARIWVLAGAIFGFLSVAGGAFGAHALKTRLSPDLLDIFQTGTRYAQVHALALVLVGLLADRLGGRTLTVAGGGFTAGTLLFTGSLWVLALSGQRWLGAVTPLGGLCFLTGWVALAVAAWRWPGA